MIKASSWPSRRRAIPRRNNMQPISRGLQKLPDGPDDVPIWVELRFDPGRYDLNDGLFKDNERINCSHLLLNGQNATITSHFPHGVTAGADSPLLPHGRTASWLFASKAATTSPCRTSCSALSCPPLQWVKSSTSARINGTIQSIDIQIKDHHASLVVGQLHYLAASHRRRCV